MLSVAAAWAGSLPAFQPHSAFGNTIHVATADFDGVGAKDFVVTADVDGVVSAFARPATIKDPTADNRIWNYSSGSFAFMLGTAKSNRSASARDHILLPGADGHLRMLDAHGRLRLDLSVGSGPTYCAAAGFDSSGAPRIVAGGVDGHVYVYDFDGSLVGSMRPYSAHNRTSIVRRVVVGNFDGAGGDEVAVFFNTGGFSGNGFFTLYDLDTLRAPSYWNTTQAASDDVVVGLGWTDKQLPMAFDMDLDGDDELVAHWGVLHPEKGPQTLQLSTMVAPGERLQKENQYNEVHPFTPTNKYIMQKGVAGRFREAKYPGMVTVYGDDLYHLNYNVTKPWKGKARFRVDDYAYAHTLFHFTDGAVLQSRQPGELDRLVLSGPNNGDDRFYIVDLAAGNGSDWRAQAKKIDNGGALIEIRSSLDRLSRGIADFAGAEADGGSIIWIQPVNGTATAWKLPQPEMDQAAQRAATALHDVYVEYFGRVPSRVTIYADISLDVSKHINATCAVRWVRALAQRGVHMQILVGHGGRVFVSPDEVSQLFDASVVNNHSYLMLATKELQLADDLLVYTPLMDALIDGAAKHGLAPAKLMLSPKGAVLTGLTPAQFATLQKYRSVAILGAENSNVRVNEWCFAERASLWLSGAFDTWAGNPIGDHIATNRISEWSAMRNGHMVLRQLLSTYAMGATVFRSDNTIPQQNPLFDRGDTSDPSLQLGSGYRQGIVPFLRLVEAGVFPAAPAPSQLRGLAPVALALPAPDARFRDQSIFHDFDRYAPQPKAFAVNNLECWHAYTNVPDYDVTAIAHGSTRRWDSLFPHSPAGFVPTVPFSSRAQLEDRFAWCNRSFETDTNTWTEFGDDVTAARDAIGAELLRQRDANAMLVVEAADASDPDSGRCFWQLTRSATTSSGSAVLFLLLMDPAALSPSGRHVSLRLGGGAPPEAQFDVFDQLGSQTTPLGTLGFGGGALKPLEVRIPAGAVRLLTLQGKNI